MIRIVPDFSGVIDTKKYSGRASLAEVWLASEILKDTRPYVPALTMSLNQRSHAIGKTITYPGPYARYLYMGKVMVNAKTGKGPPVIPGVGPRWPKGAKLRATSRPLTYGTSVHAQATDHWIEASTVYHLEKWRRGAAKLIAQGGGVRG